MRRRGFCKSHLAELMHPFDRGGLPPLVLPMLEIGARSIAGVRQHRKENVRYSLGAF